MTTRQRVSLPWERIALVLGLAAIGAWMIGFGVGLIVRFALGW